MVIISYFCAKENRNNFRTSLLRTKMKPLTSFNYFRFTPSINFDNDMSPTDYVREYFLTSRERDFLNVLSYLPVLITLFFFKLA